MARGLEGGCAGTPRGGDRNGSFAGPPAGQDSVKRRVVSLLVALAAGFAAPRARGDDWTPRRSFRTFSKANWRGLPQSSVMALAEDTDGVLWIGTLDGAASFDGKSITPVPAV